MNPQLRRQIAREFPELAAGYHLPMMAEIIAVPDAPREGGIHDNYRPRLAANVQLLNTQYEQTGIVLNNVPVSQMGGGNERGMFAIPAVGTIVELAWLNGSPELPFIRSVLGSRQALPHMQREEMRWQQSQSSYQSTDAAGNWNRHTTETISDKAHSYELAAAESIVTLGQELRRILQHSYEDIDGKKQIEVTAIHLLSATVLNLLATGSINLAAAEHITRAAAKDIKDNAENDITHEAGNDYNISAGNNAVIEAANELELTANKIKLGNNSDNLLTLVSDAMQACVDGFTAAAALTVVCAKPGDPSSPPINMAAYTAAATQITDAKSKVDAMTL